MVTFHRLGESKTRVTVQMDYQPSGLLENVADKLSLVDRRVEGDLERFKGFIEARGSETGAWRGCVDAPPTSGNLPSRARKPSPAPPRRSCLVGGGEP